jgi:hypothetical protein
MAHVACAKESLEEERGMNICESREGMLILVIHEYTRLQNVQTRACGEAPNLCNIAGAVLPSADAIGRLLLHQMCSHNMKANWWVFVQIRPYVPEALCWSSLFERPPALITPSESYTKPHNHVMWRNMYGSIVEAMRQEGGQVAWPLPQHVPDASCWRRSKTQKRLTPHSSLSALHPSPPHPPSLPSPPNPATPTSTAPCPLSPIPTTPPPYAPNQPMWLLHWHISCLLVVQDTTSWLGGLRVALWVKQRRTN